MTDDNVEINDDDHESIDMGFLDTEMLSLIQQIVNTGKWTDEDGSDHVGNKLLYPIYGGKAREGGYTTPPMGPNAPVYVKYRADALAWGQSAVVIVNHTTSALKVTRPYRDGGYMSRVPHGPDGTANVIPALVTIEGEEAFYAAAYMNDPGSGFYGSGAVLQISPTDGGFPDLAVAYGTSINGGGGLAVTHDITLVGDVEDWYDNTADNTDSEPGASLHSGGSLVTDKNGEKSGYHIGITGSYGTEDRLDDTRGGGLFTILIDGGVIS